MGIQPHWDHRFRRHFILVGLGPCKKNKIHIKKEINDSNVLRGPGIIARGLIYAA